MMGEQESRRGYWGLVIFEKQLNIRWLCGFFNLRILLIYSFLICSGVGI